MIRESSYSTSKHFIFKIHERQYCFQRIDIYYIRIYYTSYYTYINILFLINMYRQVTCNVFLWTNDCVLVNITQTPHKQYHKQCENVYVYEPARSAILPDGFYNIPRNSPCTALRNQNIPKYFIFCFGHFITASTFRVISPTRINCIQRMRCAFNAVWVYSCR